MKNTFASNSIILAANPDRAALEALMVYMQKQFGIKPERIEIVPTTNSSKFAVRYTPAAALQPSTESMLTNRAEGFLAGWKARG